MHSTTQNTAKCLKGSGNISKKVLNGQFFINEMLQRGKDKLFAITPSKNKFETFQTISASKSSKNYSKWHKIIPKENNFLNGIRLFQKASNYSRRHKIIPKSIKLFHFDYFVKQQEQQYKDVEARAA